VEGQFSTFVQVLIVAVPILLAITLHEAAHGYVALRYGDDTALRMGRVTLNPFKHIDPVGTILIPAVLILSGSRFLFGYAKPVPVVFSNLRNPRFHMILVAAAGPGMNLLLALVSALLLKLLYVFALPSPFEGTEPSLLLKAVVAGCQYSIFINVLLAVFNMLPIPPLDGGRVFVGLLPPRIGAYFANVEVYGMILILALIFVLPMVTQAMGHPVSLFSTVLLPIVDDIIAFLMTLFGF
jgi:Zn-dependent protease